MKIIDLFSGIGGFSLGLERTGGFETVQFVEQDAKARQVLKKHWPNVPQHDDIRTYRPEQGTADLVCGGFPCQDISSAGRGVGIVGERSGLWTEMARVIGAVRPKWVIAENVSALRSRGLALVLQDLCALGYDAEWHCIPASAVGAPHRRDRVWVIAYRNSDGDGESTVSVDAEASGVSGDVADTTGTELQRDQAGVLGEQAGGSTETGAEVLRQSDGEAGPDIARSVGESTPPVADALRGGAEVCDTPGAGLPDGAGETLGQSSAESEPERPGSQADQPGRDGTISAGWWAVEPPVGRVAHGVPGRVDRLKQLGNSIVPQIATLIGEAILRHERH